jgi:UDP-N-acetylmuramate-alanine ligase
MPGHPATPNRSASANRRQSTLALSAEWHPRHGWTAIVDYAHTPDALEKCLRAVRAVVPEKVEGRVIVVFGARTTVTGWTIGFAA